MRQTVTSIACRYDGMLLMQQNYPELLKQQVEKYESGGKVIPDPTKRMKKTGGGLVIFLSQSLVLPILQLFPLATLHTSIVYRLRVNKEEIFSTIHYFYHSLAYLFTTSHSSPSAVIELEARYQIWFLQQETRLPFLNLKIVGLSHDE